MTKMKRRSRLIDAGVLLVFDLIWFLGGGAIYFLAIRQAFVENPLANLIAMVVYASILLTPIPWSAWRWKLIRSGVPEVITLDDLILMAALIGGEVGFYGWYNSHDSQFVIAMNVALLTLDYVIVRFAVTVNDVCRRSSSA